MSGDTMTPAEKANAELFALLEGNPETRRDLYGLVKKADPKRIIPELEILDAAAAGTNAALKQALEANEALQKRVENMEFDRKLEKARQKVINSGLVAESEIPEVEKVITERHVDYDTAAELVSLRRQATPPTPESYHKTAMDQFDVDFMKDADAAADTVAHGLVDQFMKPGARSH